MVKADDGFVCDPKKDCEMECFRSDTPKNKQAPHKNFNRPAPQRSFSPVKPGLSHHPRRSVGAEALLEPEADSAEQHV